MKKFLILLALTVCAYGQTGLGKSTITCLDKDGDGYGVGPGCLGPDADDNDSTVNTPATTLAKYGSINAFLIHIGYQSSGSPLTVWCVSTTGSDANGTSSTNADAACTKPYLTWKGFYGRLAPPYVVIFRGGTYTANIAYAPSGTASVQNVIMGYPGEKPLIDYSASSGSAVNMGATSYVTTDGFQIKANASGAGYSGGSYILYNSGSQTITFVGDVLKNCEISGGGTDSNVDADNVLNFTVEDCVIHDPNPAGQHNIYLGSNTVASSGVVVQRNILYNVHTGGYPNLQFNGRCTGCLFQDNMLYNADGQEIAFLNGVSNSQLSNNLVFDTGISSQTISFTINNGNNTGQCRVTGEPSICSWDQTGNVIENNTFWAGTISPYGGGTLSGPTIEITNQQLTTGPCGNGGSPPCGNLGGNIWRNNLIVGAGPVAPGSNSGYPPIVYAQSSPNYLALDTWTDNIINSQDGSTYVFGFGLGGSYGYHPYNCASIASMALSSTGCSTASPGWQSVSTSYFNNPGSFNFGLTGTSPAIGRGTVVGAPAFDLVGMLRPNPPAIGAYEPIEGCSIAPATLGPWTVGQTISQTITNSGCSSGPWTSSGTWPTGLSFNTSTSILSGTISGSSGSLTPSVGYGTTTNTYSITINSAPSITTPSALPNGTVGGSYSQSLTASGGTLPLAWSVVGATPTGTNLSGAGLLSGTPTTAGTFSFTASVGDANSVAAQTMFSVTINAVSDPLPPPPVPAGSVGAIDLSNTALKTACPPNNGSGGPSASYANYSFASLCAGAYLSAWSSGTIDPSRHRLLIFGGGHSDYHGDEFYALNYGLSTPTLTRLYNPDPWCNIGESGNSDTTYCGVTTLAMVVTSTSQTSVAVTGSGSFPSPPFVAIVGSENWLVTGVSATNWTVTRGYNKTTPSTYSIGQSVTTPGIGNGNTVCPITAPWGCFKNISTATPAAAHAFGCSVYMPTQDAVLWIGGGYPSGNVRAFTWWQQFSGAGDNITSPGSAIWVAKDPVNGTGTPSLPPINVSPDSSGYMCTYDSLDDTVIVTGISLNGIIWKYHPATNTYTGLTGSASYTVGGMEAAFSPSLNELWYIGGNSDPGTAFKAGYIDMSGKGGYAFVDESSTLSGTCGGMFATTLSFPGFDWDTYSSKFVGYPGTGNTVYVLDPVALSCTTKALTGYTIPAVPVIGTPSGVFGKFRYTPDIPGNFVYCGGGGAAADCVSMQVDASGQLSSSACDLNGDGIVNFLDVQIAVNQAIGVTACSTADLRANGYCTVVDVQRVINATLGGACVTGP